MITFLKSFSIILVFFFLACDANSEDCTIGPLELVNPQTIIDGTAYKQSIMDCRIPKVQSFEFNNFEQTQLVASKGTLFFIPQGTFSKLDGSIIDGEITFSVLEMYNPGEIIACQLSTNGINNTQTIEPLLSESILFLNATYNGEAVLVNQEIRVFIPSENKNLQLNGFYSPSCPSLDCQVLWEISPQISVFEEPFTDPAGNIILGYQSFITELGWLSFARYNPSLEPRGIIYNKTLPEYSLSNSNVFLNYNGNSVAIGMYSEFDTINGVFSEKYRQIPQNTPANVIFVSKPENSFSFGSSTVITEDGKITVTRDLQNGSENNLIDYINSL